MQDEPPQRWNPARLGSSKCAFGNSLSKHAYMRSNNTANTVASINHVANGGIGKKKKTRPGQRARQAKRRRLARLEAAQEQRDSLNESNTNPGHATNQEPGDALNDAVDCKFDNAPHCETTSVPVNVVKKKRKKSKGQLARDRARSEKWHAKKAQEAAAQGHETALPAVGFVKSEEED
jgi:hypothetical protein